MKNLILSFIILLGFVSKTHASTSTIELDQSAREKVLVQIEKNKELKNEVDELLKEITRFKWIQGGALVVTVSGALLAAGGVSMGVFSKTTNDYGVFQWAAKGIKAGGKVVTITAAASAAGGGLVTIYSYAQLKELQAELEKKQKELASSQKTLESYL